MKKPLHKENEVFINQVGNLIEPWDFTGEEVIEAINDDTNQHLVYVHLRGWFSRYLDEGITDDFLNDLNKILFGITYKKYVIPEDVISSNTGFPSSAYAAQIHKDVNPEAYAANDFSRLLTNGKLKRLSACQIQECGNFFFGPPQKNGVQSLAALKLELEQNESATLRDDLKIKKSKPFSQ